MINKLCVINSASVKPSEVNSKPSEQTIAPPQTQNNDPFKNSVQGKDLVQVSTQKLSEKDLSVVFKKLEGLDGEEFCQTAYKELVKYIGLEDCAPKELTFEESEGRPIASDYKWYKNQVIAYRDVFRQTPKAQQLGYIAHELTHCKQTSNILRTNDPNIIGNYAVAISVSDFRAALVNNPGVRANLFNARQAGKEQEYINAMIQKQAATTYKELTTVFADVLKLPKHSVDSENGKKAIFDVKAQSNYNGADVNAWANCPLEKEAMAFENEIIKAYRSSK